MKEIIDFWIKYLLAWLPFLVILGGVTIFIRPAQEVGILALILGSLISLMFFNFPLTAAIQAIIQGTLIALDLSLIILGALLLYYTVELSGALPRICFSITNISTDKTMIVISLAFGFANFLHGIAGISVPPAVVAPVLIGLGFPPLDAVTLVLVGYSVNAVWGTWGVSPLMAIRLTGLPEGPLCIWIAILESVLWILTPFVLLQTLNGWEGVRKNIGKISICALGSTVTMLITAFFLQIISLVGVITGLASLLIAIILTFSMKQRGRGSIFYNNAEPERVMSLGKAWFTYGLAIAILAPINVYQPLKKSLAQLFSISLKISPKGDPWIFSPLIHTGILLIICALVGGVMQGLKKGQLKRALVKAFYTWIKTAQVLAILTACFQLCAEANMIYTLAMGTARATQSIYPLFAPFIAWFGAVSLGGLGATQIVFANFQMEIAKELGYPPIAFVAVNNAGAGFASMCTPSKIIPALALVGMVDKEGLVMRKVLPISIIGTLLVGISLYLILLYC